jgi:hypothetical protein
MIKNVIVSICLIFSTFVFSQENNASPYSYYGVGDQKFKGTADTRAMGGLGIIGDSIHLNLQNPASYSALRLTNLSVGASNTGTTFKSASGSDSANRTNIDYFAVGLPFNKIGVAFGIMPFTSVGYKIQNTALVNGFETQRQFHGEGGLNRVFAGISYSITPKFRLGAEFQYNFGNIETKSIASLPDLNVQYATREINKTSYSGASFNIGAMYETKISDRLTSITSAAFSPQANLGSTTQREYATILVSNLGNEASSDVVAVPETSRNVKLSSKFSFGTGIGMARKWFAGAEYTFQESNALGNRFDNITAAGFENSFKVSLGGYYIPNYMSYSNYLSRVTYRAGLKYEKTGLVVNNESINDYGVTLGLGLPLGGFIGGSNLNLGVEMGKRGTTSANLVQENYLSVFVGLSFNDKWFNKRRFE